MWCDSICTQLIETFSDMTSSFHVTKTETKKRNKFCAICFIQVTMTVWEWMAESYFACLSLSLPPPRAFFYPLICPYLLLEAEVLKIKYMLSVRRCVCVCVRQEHVGNHACANVSMLQSVSPSCSLWYQISLIKHQWSPSVSQSPRTLPWDHRDDHPMRLYFKYLDPKTPRKVLAVAVKISDDSRTTLWYYKVSCLFYFLSPWKGVGKIAKPSVSRGYEKPARNMYWKGATKAVTFQN